LIAAGASLQYVRFSSCAEGHGMGKTVVSEAHVRARVRKAAATIKGKSEIVNGNWW